ncbi:hydrolase [Haloterrigena longa]|uniref:Hydrolase n=2 Tax=Natrinema longum TaxID=370324 RepID=A0A8A2UB76_9EURY|nr:hydrolase [Natrinema longum]MBZ6496138.1 hydrolase [Natrinema longum]QSW85936.1 hydrolase [Natrinema longum]
MTEPGMSRLGTAYLRCLQALGRRLAYGTNVYEREWDVLVVLDACRADLLRSVAAETDVLEDVASMRSVGSSSSEWLENTFEGTPETSRTVMVTGNTWTDRYLEADAFAALDEVWKYAWDDDLGTVPAAAITDRAVALARDRDPERLVVHYMQPHHPFVPDPLTGDEGMARTGSHSNDGNPWVLLRRGTVTRERVWEAYEANLRYVLPEVATLVANVDGRVAITADHGNLFGEWGLYGHPMQTPVPALLTVPWAETTGTDRGTREPTRSPPEPLPVSRIYGAETDRDRLDALGYL